MMKQLPSLADAQKAIKGGKDPRAFLHLGIIYAQGLGAEQDEILATYFIKKAFDMGCKETKDYFNMTFIRQHLKQFYPEYNREKAISDILNNRQTIDADILFTLSTADNRSEIYIESQDRLLQQLYAPITSNTKLYNAIIEANDADLLGKDESELAQCIVNLTSSYNTICKRYGVKPQEIFSLDSIGLYPYIKISDLVLLRRQGFRALLSVRDVDTAIKEKFLKCLDSDDKLLTVCEKVIDQDIQLFLISFVELNIDIESLEISSLSLLKAYRNNNLMPLVEHLNEYVNRLNKAGIKHHLPYYTLGHLPPIDLSK